MAIHIINPVNKTKLSCNTLHRRSTTVSLETYPLDILYYYAISPQELSNLGRSVKPSLLIDHFLSHVSIFLGKIVCSNIEISVPRAIEFRCFEIFAISFTTVLNAT